MAEEIPKDHPRYSSLITRKKIVEGTKQGLLAPSAQIAHGRGEAFDYILGEKTLKSAQIATYRAALLLLVANRPVISINGNTAVLVREGLITLSEVLYEKRGSPCPLEINIFYRTPERMKNLLDFMSEKNFHNIPILGYKEDARIPGLSSERAKCDSDGIFAADTIFVPLEDGDRCEALRKMGKTVIAVDLNPFSRTARTASLTIVDNIVRVIPALIDGLNKIFLTKEQINEQLEKISFDNAQNLREIVIEIKNRLDDFIQKPLVQL